jgi:hypothetical protein
MGRDSPCQALPPPAVSDYVAFCVGIYVTQKANSLGLTQGFFSPLRRRHHRIGCGTGPAAQRRQVGILSECVSAHHNHS